MRTYLWLAFALAFIHTGFDSSAREYRRGTPCLVDFKRMGEPLTFKTPKGGSFGRLHHSRDPGTPKAETPLFGEPRGGQRLERSSASFRAKASAESAASSSCRGRRMGHATWRWRLVVSRVAAIFCCCDFSGERKTRKTWGKS